MTSTLKVHLGTGRVFRVRLHRVCLYISCSIQRMCERVWNRDRRWKLQQGLCAQKHGQAHPNVDRAFLRVSLYVRALYTSLHTGYVSSLYKVLLYIDNIYVYAKYTYIRQYTAPCARGGHSLCMVQRLFGDCLETWDICIHHAHTHRHDKFHPCVHSACRTSVYMCLPCTCLSTELRWRTHVY